MIRFRSTTVLFTVGEIILAPTTPLSLREILQRQERVVIIRTLQACDFSRSRTAEILQVSRSQLWRRMRDLHMDTQALPVVRTGRPRGKAL